VLKAGGVVSQYQVRLYQRLARQQAPTNDIGAQLQRDVVSLG